eukprot:CFRG2383T1
MHGIHDSEYAWDHFKKWIDTHHPGTPVYAIPLFSMLTSFAPLWKQSDGIARYIRDKVEKDRNRTFADGYHLVCHSQGALTCRAVVETMSDHNIHTFVSLAGPQMGIFGAYSFLETFFPNTGPHLVWRVAYSWVAQRALSVCNMWKDVMSPRSRQAYYAHQEFLPVLNNERNHTGPPHFAHNMIRLKKAVFFGSPDDTEIMPWESTVFGYYTPSSPNHIVPMKRQPVYRNDAFGLRTLDEDGRLFLNILHGIAHNDWIHSEAFVVTYLIPLMT